MKGWLIVNEFLNWNKFNEIHTWLLDAAKRHGISMELKTNAQVLIVLSEAKALPDLDFILFWDKDVRLAQYLEQSGYRVFNSSEAIRICDDKSLTHLTLMKAGIPMPETIIAPFTYENIGYTNVEFLDEVGSFLGFPMVVKECFGSFGQQVYLVKDMEELRDKVRQIGSKPMLFQKYIHTTFGRDLRLQVVGNEVVASMLRFSNTGDFRANLTIGGKMKPHTPTKRQWELAVESCKILGLDFGGIDLLFDDQDEPIVCEVNSNAHFKNIYDCTGINVADRIMNYLLEWKNSI